MRRDLLRYGNIVITAIFLAFLLSPIGPSTTVKIYLALVFIVGQGLYRRWLAYLLADK